MSIKFIKVRFNLNNPNDRKAYDIIKKVSGQNTYIKNAVISVTKRNGMTKNYYGYEGAVYINPIEKMIKTAFSSSEYTGNLIELMEVLKKYGL